MAAGPDESFHGAAMPKLTVTLPENTATGDGGLTVEDVTEEYDRGYEGDAEAQLPDETEEADSESESELALQNGSPNEASLVKDFRNLHCETPKQEPLLLGLSGSRRVSRKRSHSRLLSDTESEVLFEVSRASTPSRKRQRRRVKDCPNPTETSTRETDGMMDFDSVSSPVRGS